MIFLNEGISLIFRDIFTFRFFREENGFGIFFLFFFLINQERSVHYITEAFCDI